MAARAVLMSCGLLVATGIGWALYSGHEAASERSKPATVGQPRSTDQTEAIQPPKPAERSSVPAEKPTKSVVAATPEPAHTARNVAPAVAAPEGDAGLQREEPRPPLSQLSLALPPKPDIGKGSKLFQPVAVESAVVESQGRRVAISGTRSVAADVRCTHDGKDWPCGMRARTAFRLLLRGRALNCAIPDTDERTVLVAECRLGKLDVGAWLVKNGWAHAAPGGPYAEDEAAARRGGKGIFGPPPS